MKHHSVLLQVKLTTIAFRVLILFDASTFDMCIEQENHQLLTTTSYLLFPSNSWQVG